MASAAVLFALALLALPGVPAGLFIDVADPVPVAVTWADNTPKSSAGPKDPTGLPGMASFPLTGGAFIQNRGQLGRDDVLFYSAGALSAYFSPGAVEYRVSGVGCRVSGANDGVQGREEPVPSKNAACIFGMRFLGANNVIPRGIEPLPFYYNYFLGNDPAKWRPGVPAFGAVVYEGIYDGIDAEFRPSGGGVKYEFSVHPGADPSAIRLRYEGAHIQQDPEGLLLTTPAGAVRDGGLEVFQTSTGKNHPVEARFSVSENDVSFDVGAYERALPLVIDPQLSPAINSSTLIGGGGDEFAAGMALDAVGNAYITGETLSQDFPASPGAFDNVSRICGTAGYDVFVLKMRPDGKTILWCTFLGSSGNDYAHGIAVDDYGFAHVCGNCFDFDFPITGFAFDEEYNGYGDAFVVKLNPAGSALVYSTFIGGEYVDHGYAIALDASQNVYLTGSTASMEFPTTEGAFCRSIHAGTGLEDAFAAKLHANGSSLEYSTFIGGGGVDYGAGIAADRFGRAFIVGSTDSVNFPVTAGAIDRPSGGMDVFALRLEQNGMAMGFCVQLGGNDDDAAAAIALDGQGCAYIAGTSGSNDFPDTAFHRLPLGPNGFAFGLDANGTEMLFSRQLGGSADDSAAAIRLDASGNIYVAGTTSSSNIQTTNKAACGAPQGGTDACLFKLSGDAEHVLYSTYIGGAGNDGAAAMALDPAGRAWLAGDTSSADFPVTDGSRHQNGSDVFVMRLDVICTPTEPVLRTSTGDREVVLDWTAPEIGAKTVLRYDIHRGPSPDQLAKFISMDGSARTAHDRMVHNGQTYYYAVRAVNSSGEGAMSGAAGATPGLPPTEPWGMAAAAGPGMVRLSWICPNRTFDLPILTYKVYRWRTYLGQINQFLVDVNSTTYDDTSPLNDQLYFYRVSAVTKMGESPLSDPVSATPSNFPSPPPGLEADAIGRQVVLGWKAPLNTGSRPILYYNIYRRIEGDRERLYANASSTVYMTGRLPAGTYHFRVAAVSETSVGYFSDDVAVTVFNQPPEASVTAEPTRATSATRFNFTPNALDPDGLIANYSWSFGDGGRSFKENPFHVYKSRGHYNVTLRVTDDDGAVTESILIIEVLNTPPKITVPDPAADVTLETKEKGGFDVLPVDPDEDPLHVSWYLDGEQAGEGSHFSASFEKTGFYRLKAVAYDGMASDEHVWTVTVVQAPPPPSQPVNYYALGLASAVLIVACGLLLGLRIGLAGRKRPPAKAKGQKAGKRPRRRSGRKAKSRKAAGGQSKRIL